MVRRSWAALLATWLVGATATMASAQTSFPDEVYRLGTDAGMRYISLHTARLRVTVVLEQCELPKLASTVSEGLPNSLEFFMRSSEANQLSNADAMYAAQVARAYILGFESAMRTEFEAWSASFREQACATVVKAADSLINK